MPVLESDRRGIGSWTACESWDPGQRGIASARVGPNRLWTDQVEFPAAFRRNRALVPPQIHHHSRFLAANNQVEFSARFRAFWVILGRQFTYPGRCLALGAVFTPMPQ